MKSVKFKKGDKVVFINDEKHKTFPYSYPECGTVGEILLVLHDKVLRIKWPEGTTDIPNIWNAQAADVVLQSDYKKKKSPKIIIYVDGENDRNVIAKDLSSGRTAVARCSPADEFNFYTGAELAMSRLREAARAPQADDIRPVTSCKFKVGDIIIGNKKANKYGITKQHWVGKVVRVYERPRDGGGCDIGKAIWFTAAPANAPDSYDLPLDQDAFDRA